MKVLWFLQLMAIRFLKVIRFACAALAVYFLFLTIWQLAYMHKVRQWPAVEAKLVRRETSFFRGSLPAVSRRTGGAYGLTFIKESFYVPSVRAWVSAQDFGYLSPRRAEQEFRKRQHQYPVGSIMSIRMNPRYPSEATTLGSGHGAFSGEALTYLMYAAGCLVLYALLRTFP